MRFLSRISSHVNTKGQYLEEQDLAFFDILRSTLRNKATDPRDHLYSIRAISKDASAIITKLDYGAKVADVFADAVLSYAKIHGSLDLLCFAHLPKHRTDLPSWVPDFSCGRYNPAIDFLITRGRTKTASDSGMGFKACENQRYEFSGGLSLLTLSVPDRVRELVHASWCHAFL